MVFINLENHSYFTINSIIVVSDIEYRHGKTIPIADTLSQLYLDNMDPSFQEELDIHINPILFQQVKKKFKKSTKKKT